MTLHPAAALAVLFAFAAPPAAFAATFSAGPGAGCTHATPQAALDAADGSPGPDVVRIANVPGWTAIQISTDTDQDVEIVGGYAECTSAQPSGKTTLSGAGGQARSVIALRGNGRFRLRNLVIRDGDQAGDDDGGGIHFLGGGIVEISDSEIAENSAEDGGGIYAEGTTPLAELILGANVTVSANTARRHGGGVVAQNLEMSMIEPGSVLFMNTAGERGGGLIVASGSFPAYAYIGTSGIGDLGAVYGNKAAIGGGIALLAGENSDRDAIVHVFSTDASRPQRIRANEATNRGGGIDLQPDGDLNYPGNANESGANAYLRNVAIEDNVAPVGAAINLANDSYFQGEVGGELTFNTSQLHPAAAGCPFGAPCGYIRGNRTLNTTGAVVHLSEDAGFTGKKIAFEDNEGGYLMYLAGYQQTALYLDNSLIAGNTTTNELIRKDEYYDELLVWLHHLTIADNAIGAASVLSINEDLAFSRSVVDQPGKALLAPGSNGTSDVEYVLRTGQAAPGTIYALPRFVDRERGDYGLLAGSRAVDFAPASSSFGEDMYSHTRDIDLALNPDEGGTVDAGAIEREYLQPLVLNENFDAPLQLRHWDVVSAAAWDGTQNTLGAAGSGSARAVLEPGTQGKQLKVATGLSQCVHLPGPGTYRLDGSARVVPSSNPPLASNRASLAWQVHYAGNPQACGGGAPDQSGIHPLATTSAWNRPAAPAYITIPAAQWTHDTSLTVVFDVQGSPTATTTAWFDGIVLAEGVAQPGELFADGFED